MDSLKRQAPHFQLSSGYYWIVPPFAPLPAGGVEVPDWDQAYQDVLNELFNGHSYHAATVMQQLEKLGITINGFSPNTQFVAHALKQRHLFRLVKVRPVSGAGGAPPARTLAPPKPPEVTQEGVYTTFDPFRSLSPKATQSERLSFRALRWNVTQADVEEPVECQFDALGVKASQDITLLILEQRPGQEAHRLTSLSHTMTSNGPQKVLWQPSSIETFSSIGATPPKAAGPYQYFFRIEAGPIKSERSPPLTLCRTVIVEVMDSNGSCLTDECRVSLETADGQVLITSPQNGEARFERVVIGSSKISILDCNHRT